MKRVGLLVTAAAIAAAFPAAARGPLVPVPAPNPVAANIAKNPEQLARVTTMLPEGMTLEQATTGFRTQGEFFSALGMSRDLKVSFAKLQKAMTVDGLTLAQATRRLRMTRMPIAPAIDGGTSGSVATTGTGAPAAKDSGASPRPARRRR